MNRNAFKVPLLNRDGRIDKEMLPNYDENSELGTDYANYLVDTNKDKLNVGSGGRRIYFSDGVPVGDTTTIGSESRTLYLKNGVFTASDRTPVFRLSNPGHTDGPKYNLAATNPTITLCHNQTYKTALWEKIDQAEVITKTDDDGNEITIDPIFSYVDKEGTNVDDGNLEWISYPNSDSGTFWKEGAIAVGGEWVQFKVNSSTQDFFTLQVHIKLGGQDADDDIIRINVNKLVKYIFNYTQLRFIKSIIAFPFAQDTRQDIPPIAAYWHRDANDNNYAYIHGNTGANWHGVSIIIKYN